MYVSDNSFSLRKSRTGARAEDQLGRIREILDRDASAIANSSVSGWNQPTEALWALRELYERSDATVAGNHRGRLIELLEKTAESPMQGRLMKPLRTMVCWQRLNRNTATSPNMLMNRL